MCRWGPAAVFWTSTKLRWVTRSVWRVTMWLCSSEMDCSRLVSSYSSASSASALQLAHTRPESRTSSSSRVLVALLEVIPRILLLAQSACKLMAAGRFCDVAALLNDDP